jgi:hypothetical protein
MSNSTIVGRCPAMPMSEMGLGCVKTRSSQGWAELLSQLPSSDRSCQCNWFPHRRSRDGNSTRKFNVRVFTRPRSQTEVESHSRRVRSTPTSGHRQTGPACPKSAKSENRRRSLTSVTGVLDFTKSDRPPRTSPLAVRLGSLGQVRRVRAGT